MTLLLPTVLALTVFFHSMDVSTRNSVGLVVPDKCMETAVEILEQVCVTPFWNMGVLQDDKAFDGSTFSAYLEAIRS